MTKPLAKELEDRLAKAQASFALYGGYYPGAGIRGIFNECADAIGKAMQEPGDLFDPSSKKAKAVRMADLLISYRQEDMERAGDKEALWSFTQIANDVEKVENIMTKGYKP